MKKRNDRLDIAVTVDWKGRDKRRDFLKHLIEVNNFKVMAEVGVRRGGTTFHLLDLLPNLTIYAIDTNISQFYNEKVAARYGNRLKAIQMYSDKAADMFQDESLDLVFIDADHSYEAVKKDIIKYTPKIKKNGLLTGHDIDYPGVNRAVRELIVDFDVGPNNVWIRK